MNFACSTENFEHKESEKMGAEDHISRRNSIPRSMLIVAENLTWISPQGSNWSDYLLAGQLIFTQETLTIHDEAFEIDSTMVSGAGIEVTICCSSI